MSYLSSDFIQSSLRTHPKHKGVKQFGKGPRLEITHTGTVKWRIEDDKGKIHNILIPNSFLVPQGSSRLLSPQHWSEEAFKEGTHLDPDATRSTQYHDRNVLFFGDQGQYQCTVYNDTRANVPYFYTAPGNILYNKFVKQAEQKHKRKVKALESVVCYPATAGIDDDLSQLSQSPPDLGEPSYSPSHHVFTVEELTDFTSTAQRPNMDAMEEEEEHMAATSDRGELIRWHHRLGHMSFDRLQNLAKANIIPRRLSKVKKPKCVACIYGKMHRKPWRNKGSQRQIRQASKPGDCVSVDQMQSSCHGFVGQLKGKLTTKRYKYATVFTDHFSRYKYVYLQATLTSAETLQAKRAFEAHARNLGVQIMNYHADNGRFADNAFINDVRLQGQEITYCGVNAHWQNGIAEKAIRDLRENARTSLLHAMQRWPSAVIVQLWPYALRYAMEVANNVPKGDGGLSAKELFSQVEVASNMSNFHTFGCPVYALDNRLQAQQAVSSWAPRARMGINLGPSPRHARNVTLVLSLSTGLVSPQFHVKHDEFFETIDRKKDVPSAPWMTLARFKNHRRSNKLIMKPSREPEIVSRVTNDLSVNEERRAPQSPDVENEHEIAYGNSQTGNTNDASEGVRTEQYTTRSGRAIHPPERFDPTAHHAYYEVLHEEDYHIQDSMDDPLAFKASGDPDTMYYHEAMLAPDKREFLHAIVKEVNAHIENNHWELILKKDVPKDAKILDSIWAMKRKRDIRTREVYKHKARLNIHGGQQEYGVHYTETYSPVVNWFSVRTMLIFAIINRWHTRQIDFVLAYPQAPLPYDNYMKLPAGIKSTKGDDTHVLKLKKNLYGGRNSGRIWNKYLHEGLLNIGFKQSNVDECVYYRGKCIFLCYVDDGILIHPDPKEIDQVIADLRNMQKAKARYVIEDQGDIKDYLGINFEDLDNGRIKLSQPHLIDQIIEEVGISPSARKSTPCASTKPLRRDESGEELIEPPFEYRRIIGKLNFLEKSSRPDIAYAAHQCARFSSAPKKVHYEAVIHLTKYLQATRNQGMILDPDQNKSFEAYADADFAGNWYKGTAMDDPSTSKSRSGYVITYANCPIIWGSKLQTCIALSTTEAEYVALSQCLRETIPIMNLVKELKKMRITHTYTKPIVRCKAFEDNTGALEIANVHKMRPRTKHINNIYHHFRSYVREGEIGIQYISTEDQLADMFTKALPQNTFQKLRKELLHF